MKKRIALAAVAALGAGLLVAAPASAAVVSADQPFAVATSQATGGQSTSQFVAYGWDTGTVATATAPSTQTLYQIAGASNYVTIKAQAVSVANDYASLTVAGGTLTSSSQTCQTSLGGLYTKTSTTIYDGSSLCGADTYTATVASTPGSINVPTTAAGTLTVNVYGNATVNGVATSTLLQVYSVVVSAAPAGSTYNHTTLGALTASVGTTYLNAAGNGFTPSKLGNSETFTITQYSSADNTVALGASSALTQPVTVSLSGVGTLSQAASTQGATYLAFSGGSTTVPANGTQTIFVTSDGRSGVATVSIAVNGVVIGTKTVTFYGDVATLATTQSAYVLNTTAASVKVGTLMAKDASGIEVPLNGFTVTGTSSNSAVLVTASESGSNAGLSDSNTVAVHVSAAAGAVSGASASVTFSLVNAAGATISAAPVTVSLGGAVATVSASFDTATYAPGTKAVVTVKALDSTGHAAYDGQAADASAWGSNLAAQGLPAAAVTSLSNGSATVTLYAPVANGTWTVSFSANDGLATHATVSASAAVGDMTAAAAAAATAAAAKATSDAIAALQTSIGSLTTTVAALVASMTAQIKVINATLRIQSKALAKIKKALHIK